MPAGPRLGPGWRTSRSGWAARAGWPDLVLPEGNLLALHELAVMRGSAACISASDSPAEIDALRLGRRHQPPGDMVRIAERQLQHAHQPVRQIGRGGEAGSGELAHPRQVRRHVAHHAGDRGQRQRPGLGRVEHRLLVLLHVLGIGERQALHHGQQRDQRAGDPPGLRPHQLGRIRIALLRHDRTAGGEGVRQPDEPPRRRAPDHDLLGEARQMHRRDRRGAQELQREVAVRHGIERIGGRPVETQRLRRHRAVDRERGAGQRRAAQRAFVQPAAAIGEPAAVAVQHLDIGQQMMAERHRLRGLQMGEAGHRIGGMRRGAIGQRAHHVGDLRASARRSRRAPTGGNPSPPGRCGCARCAGGGRPRRCARSAAPRCSCGCLRAPRRTGSVRSRSRARSLLDRCGWPAHPVPR